MAAALPYIMIGSTLLQAGGQIQAGAQQKAAMEQQASALEREGQAAFASAQRQSMEERRKGRIAESRARAVAGASGGDVSALSPEFAKLQDRAEYNALSALYEGDTARQGARDKAAVARMEGSAYATAANTKAFGTLLEGGTSFFDRYGSKL